MDKGQYNFTFKKLNSASKAPVIDGDTPLFSRNYVVKMLESLRADEVITHETERVVICDSNEVKISGCILALDTIVMLAAGDMLTKDKE